MRIFIILLSFIPLCLYSQNVKYADSTLVGPKAKINDVAWIQGNWQAELFGKTVEEIWSKPSSKTMMSVAKLHTENKIEFYEICTISEENESLILRIRHFDSNLNAWEEKNKAMEFKLIEITPKFVYFDGYTFEKVDENKMNIHLLIESEKDNKEITINYFRN